MFIESFAPPPRMIIFGAVDFTAALAKVAKVLGYRVTVCDARPVFATRARFPMADEVVVAWPDRYLGRGRRRPRAARRGLRAHPRPQVRRAGDRRRPGDRGRATSAPWARGAPHDERIGAAARGGRRPTAELARVMAPIGLDIGARTPEETAVAICAEIIALRTGRTAPSLARPSRRTDPPQTMSRRTEGASDR